MTATWHHMRKLAMPLVPNHCGLGNQQGAVRMVTLVLTGPKNQKLQRKGRLCQSDKGMWTLCAIYPAPSSLGESPHVPAT